MIAFIPPASLAADTSFFIAVNDSLLPYSDDTMPLVIDGVILVPDSIFSEAGVWSVSSVEREQTIIYMGMSRLINFYTALGETRDQNNNLLNWPPAQRIGRRFYVPLIQVCDYYGLRYQILPVPDSVIPDRSMQVIRILSDYVLNGPTFIGLHGNTMKSSYDEYHAPPPVTPPDQPPNPLPNPQPNPQPATDPPAATVTEPDYSDITMFISFFDISAGDAEQVLDLLDIQAALGFYYNFFVSADDIISNPGLIRRITGSGHIVGIWLTEGTDEEYNRASDLLFEAAKIRTVLVSADEAAETALDMAALKGLQFWSDAQRFTAGGENEELSVEAVVEALATESGSRQNLLFPCIKDIADILPGVYAYLWDNEYKITRITETVRPINNALNL